MSKRKYAVRYHIEPWDKEPIDRLEKTTLPGVKVNKTNYGYTDILFVASILLNESGEIASILLLDSKDQLNPSREILEAVKQQIEHQLEHHCK